MTFTHYVSSLNEYNHEFNKMHHFPESALEKYLRQPELLEANVRLAITSHLPDCEECSEIIEFLQDFYQKLHEPRKETVSPLVKTFLDHIFPPGAKIIPLFPFKPGVQDCLEGDSRHPRVLAAKSKNEAAKKFTTVAVFASPEKNVLVRINGNREAGVYRVSVKASDPQKHTNIALSVPDLALKVATDSNGTGVFSLAGKNRQIDFEKLECYLELENSE